MNAAAILLKWKDTERIFDSWKSEIYETKDVITYLLVSMLTALGLNSNLELVYGLFKENPPAVMSLLSFSEVNL